MNDQEFNLLLGDFDRLWLRSGRLGIGWGHPLSGTKEMWMAPFVHIENETEQTSQILFRPLSSICYALTFESINDCVRPLLIFVTKNGGRHSIIDPAAKTPPFVGRGKHRTEIDDNVRVRVT